MKLAFVCGLNFQLLVYFLIFPNWILIPNLEISPVCAARKRFWPIDTTRSFPFAFSVSVKNCPLTFTLSTGCALRTSCSEGTFFLACVGLFGGLTASAERLAPRKTALLQELAQLRAAKIHCGRIQLRPNQKAGSGSFSQIQLAVYCCSPSFHAAAIFIGFSPEAGPSFPQLLLLRYFKALSFALLCQETRIL